MIHRVQGSAPPPSRTIMGGSALVDHQSRRFVRDRWGFKVTVAPRYGVARRGAACRTTVTLRDTNGW